jgi:hypothetical protein
MMQQPLVVLRKDQSVFWWLSGSVLTIRSSWHIQGVAWLLKYGFALSLGSRQASISEVVQDAWCKDERVSTELSDWTVFMIVRETVCPLRRPRSALSYAIQ